MAGIFNRYIALTLLVTAQLALLLVEATGRPAAASDDTALATCSFIYNESACRCALTAIASTGGELEASQRTQVAAISAPSAATPSAGIARVQFSIRDLTHVVQACMAPSRDGPAD